MKLYSSSTPLYEQLPLLKVRIQYRDSFGYMKDVTKDVCKAFDGFSLAINRLNDVAFADIETRVFASKQPRKVRVLGANPELYTNSVLKYINSQPEFNLPDERQTRNRPHGWYREAFNLDKNQNRRRYKK